MSLKHLHSALLTGKRETIEAAAKTCDRVPDEVTFNLKIGMFATARSILERHIATPDVPLRVRTRAAYRPVGWLRQEHHGRASHDPLYLTGAHDPGRGLHGATYRQVFEKLEK